jgi:hypothetical protein
VYKPLVERFIDAIKHVKCKGLPEPFFPVFGREYATANTRIVFAGMETRGCGNLVEFLDHVDLNSAIFRNVAEFDKHAFLKWGNRPANDFFGFVLKFLAKFHGVADWRSLRAERPEILSSFAWANTNSIERYHVTAKGNGVKWEDWKAIKDASAILDDLGNIMASLSPNVLVLLNWGSSGGHSRLNEWIKSGLGRNSTCLEVEDHLLWLESPDCPTRVLWTAHPTWTNKNRDFDAFVAKCANVVKDRI